MNFDEVGRVWREQDTGEFLRTRTEDLSSARDRAAKFDARARRYWWLGTVGAIVVVPYFGFFAIWGIIGGYLVATLGLVIVGISSAILAIRWRRLRGATPDSSLPVSAALEAQVSRLRAWERYKETVGWWYLGPLVVGVLVVAVGSSVNMAGDPVSLGLRVRISIFMMVACVLQGFYMHRDARLNVRPLREDLESWLADLRDSDLGGVTDVG